jgi:hypothetical protein
MNDEMCTMKIKYILGDAGETNVKKTADPVAQAAELAELPTRSTGSVGDDRVATLPKPLGVRYSQSGRYQP